ncbi:MAG: FkbM family methyltransferase [Candidatus Daviesbacteria bacterium]|nr:FkbM family methyltransferase [Candidatus Daviesbacteria bacterium]
MLRSKIIKYINLLLGVDPVFFQQQICLKKHFGTPYGGWTIALEGINKNSIIYSFGIGTDISFDLDLIKKYSLTINAFDPTPKSLEWLKQQKIPKSLKVYQWGIADYDGKEKFTLPPQENFVSFRKTKKDKSDKNIKLPVFQLSTIMKKLGHKRIDILKMDIEGFEYQVIENILKSNLEIKQILVEFHHRFSGFSKKDTEKAINKLNKFGYKIFNISDVGLEYSLIKKYSK